MRVVWDAKALDDYRHFEAKVPKLAQRVRDLIADIKRSPFQGIGKPEPLRFDFAGCWSRRIDQQHRLVYRIEGETLQILRCRWHYGA
jgi:toxin YoeB